MHAGEPPLSAIDRVHHRDRLGPAAGECPDRLADPTLDSVESIFAEFRRRLRYTLPSKARFAAELLLREALTNAVIHGSGANPAMSVHCAIRMRDRKLIIAVADGGPGFDWHSQSGQTADSASCSGRGLEIFRKFATRVRFSARGNLVTLVKDFKEGLTP